MDEVDIVDLPASGSVVVHARAVHVEAGSLELGRALLEDATGALWAEGIPDHVQRGDRVRVEGQWDGQRLHVSAIEVEARPTRPFPSAGSDHAWLTEDARKRLGFLRRRAVIFSAIREVLDERGLMEVETPLAVPSPGLDLHLDAIQVKGSTEPRFLITSPEYQMKRLLSAGLGHIYQIAKCFRRGELGPRHQPEFTMLEWYRSPGTLDDVLSDTQAIVRIAAAASNAMSLKGERGPIDLSGPFSRLSVSDAFRQYAGCELFDVLPDEERFYRILVETIEPQLGRERPVFLTRWPASMASLARLCPDDARFAERAELFIDGMELCNAFGELTDPAEQRRRLLRDQGARRDAGLPVYPLDERFLAALEDGIPESGGNALGLDRLVMLCCGTRSIDDVVAIPASRL